MIGDDGLREVGCSVLTKMGCSRYFPLCLDRPASLDIKEHFVPLFIGEHLHAYCIPRED